MFNAVIGSGLIVPSAGTPVAITVTQVLWFQPNVMEWTFSSAVTVVGVLPDSNTFQVNDGAGFSSPSSMIQVSPTVIRMTYQGDDNFNVFGGDAWRIHLVPTNVVQSASITVPQSGTTTGIL